MEAIPETTSLAQPSTLRRLGRSLAIGLAAAIVSLVILYVISRVAASHTDFDWFRGGCLILALVGVAGVVGTATWNINALELRRLGKNSTLHPFVILSCAVFGLVPFVFGIVHLPPTVRPPDADAWAGYVTTRNGITQVSATWIQPRIHARGSRPNDISFWVGLRGDFSDTLLQIGTQGDCQRHTPATYSAWYELYPAASVVIAKLAVRPGDRITATVVRIDQTRFRLTLVNATAGARFSTIQTARPMGDFRLTSFDIASDAGSLQTTTSQVSRDGTSFTVSRR